MRVDTTKNGSLPARLTKRGSALPTSSAVMANSDAIRGIPRHYAVGAAERTAARLANRSEPLLVDTLSGGAQSAAESGPAIQFRLHDDGRTEIGVRSADGRVHVHRRRRRNRHTGTHPPR